MTDAPTPIDRQILAALEADTSRDLVPELIRIFVKSADSRIDQITRHLAAANFAGIAAEAHALKSSSATFGASTVRWICAELEAAGKAGDAAAVDRLAAELGNALEAAKRDLAAYVTEVSG
jgi:HPt (histidine-containing phosphotransfer) domain-containing protein